MSSEAFSFSRVQNYYFIVTVISKDLSPLLFSRSIEPHELVFASSLDLAVIFGVKGFKLILENLGGRLVGNENNAESAFST